MSTKIGKSDKSGVLHLFWSYWWRWPKLFLISLLMGPALSLQNVLTPLFVAIGLSQLVRQHHVDVKIMVFATVSLFAAMIFGYFINTRSATKLEDKVEGAMYNDTFEYLIHQDYDFFANNFSGSLVTKANRLVKAYSLFHLTFFLEILPQLWGVVIALAIMLYFNLILGLAITILWLVSVAVITFLAIRRIPIRRGAVSEESKQTGELADSITNALTIKTFAAESREMERYANTNAKRGVLFLRSWHWAIRNGWVVEVLCGILQLTIFIGGVLAVEHKTLTLAIFLLFQVYILRIVDSLRQTNLIVRQLEGVLGDAQEMTELLQEPPLVKDALVTKPFDVSSGNIDLQNISFEYPDNTTAAHDSLFRNFSLSINPGEKIGLVGPSGGGKTTITKLLLRFMDVTEGSIAVDGQDIREVKQTDLRSAIAYVPQEPLLFHRSIKENIGYGHPNASQKDIAEAATKARADEFINKLPKGYDTIVGERGVKLSGGQRQRVAIARAILKNASIILLDEATSALDSESEKAIQEALWQLMEGRTALVIAHRLSTIQKMDRIVVLDDGKITEQGTHKQLLARKGLYARLWAHQSGGFLEDE